MSESNKSYRIRTNVGSANNGAINLDVNLLQDYDIFEILSLKIDTENLYHLHTSKYGCLVGRVVANGGVGVPNAKLSVFIEADSLDLNDPIFNYLYPYTNTRTKNRDNIRYNLLTDQKIDDCHQNIGTFPNKRLVLDDYNYIEIFDKYYKFTTTTNGSGDYMIFGLPVGNNIIHSDLDLSDIGILSQKPRDLFYKGYSATQFENASQFKKDTNLDNLTQVFSQDSSVYVYPFWGDETENADQIKITRSDVDINYKFEPTCIFIGSIVSDEKSNAISKRCIPSERMGKMDRLTTGRGTIEMIRKTLAGNVESIAIQGTELIDGNGTWCYQIPMNLDYMKTDEYGNLVPTNDIENGIPTRTRVRFRVSLADYESDYENTHLVKVLVPNNPVVNERKIEYDYEFGSATSDESFRDLFWNDVYTVKSYIPRFQKGNRQRNKNFTGFKAVNVNGANNPIPYNNMRINLTFLFVFQCLIFKSLVMIVKILNKIIYIMATVASWSKSTRTMMYITLDGGMCPNLEGNYIAPGAENWEKGGSRKPKEPNPVEMVILNTYHSVFGDEITEENLEGNLTGEKTKLPIEGSATASDPKSADTKNGNYSPDGKKLNKKYTNDDGETESVKIYNNDDYFIKCVELQFAMEYEVIQFDFYNDWINGTIYIPRWFAEARKNKDGMVYCGETFSYNRNLVHQCALKYQIKDGNITTFSDFGCSGQKQKCHKSGGRKYVKIFGDYYNGIVERLKTSKGHYVYYLRPSEMYKDRKANLFATDLVLLGSVTDCNQYGIPKVKGYTSSSYIMPPPTGEIISDSQEMEINNGKLYGESSIFHTDVYDYRTLYQFNKISLPVPDSKDGEYPYSELSGIDWGYDPYDSGSNDDTTKVYNQITGHFLEIGCTFSLSNVKSCINLSRICELGSEMSQSHYYSGVDEFVRPAGIIGKREINNEGIRTTFTTLNSNGLKTGVDTRTGYLRYIFNGYLPNTFMGELTNKLKRSSDNGDWYKLTESDYGFVEGISKSYKAFRFGTTDLSQLTRKFLWDGELEEEDKGYYYMPVFENSLYFYFGLKNGSTAIDRLYSEYYADCPETKYEKDNTEPSLVLTTTIIKGKNNLIKTKYFINYVVEGMGKITESMFKIEVLSDGKWTDCTKNVVINLRLNNILVPDTGMYRVTITNKFNKSVSGEVKFRKEFRPIGSK